MPDWERLKKEAPILVTWGLCTVLALASQGVLQWFFMALCTAFTGWSMFGALNDLRSLRDRDDAFGEVRVRRNVLLFRLLICTSAILQFALISLRGIER